MRRPLNSVCQKRRSLSFYNRFINQQDRNSVANRVCAMALPALENIAVLVVGQCSLTGGTSQHIDEIAVQHNDADFIPVRGTGFLATRKRKIEFQVRNPLKARKLDVCCHSGWKSHLCRH